MKSIKRFAAALLAGMIILLASCSGQKQINSDTDIATTAQESMSVTMLEEGVWPVNKYTDGLPVPAGKVAWASIDEEHKICCVNITDISETEYREFIELLKKDGFSVTDNISEEVKGQNYVSECTNLTDNQRGLSVAYIPGSLTFSVSFIVPTSLSNE